MRPLLFILLLLSACQLTRKHEKRKEENTLSTVIRNDTNKIFFLTLSIHRDSILNKNIIEKKGLTKQNGLLKNETDVFIDFPNFLVFEIFERDSLIKVMLIEHPLYKHIEYLDDNRQMTSKKIMLNSAEFFIRFQMKGDIGKINIMEKTGNNALKKLSEIVLN